MSDWDAMIDVEQRMTMNKILTPITDKNGRSTSVWKNPEGNLSQSRLSSMMGAVPPQATSTPVERPSIASIMEPRPVSFSRYSIADSKAEVMTRNFDEAVIADRLEEFAVDFALHPQIPAIYQTLLVDLDEDDVATALIENPNVSVGTVHRYYDDPPTDDVYKSAMTHPLLPIELAEQEYNSMSLKKLRDSEPGWASRVQTQIERVEKHVAARQASYRS